MKKISIKSATSRFVQDEDGYLNLNIREDAASLETTLRAIEAALLCMSEGNTARAFQVLHNVLPKDRRPIR